MSALTAPAAGTTSAPAAPPKTQAVGADFDTFLKMLTAQLKNQDPLNPMEGTEFAVQLATFSGVEQQAQTNKLMQQLVAQAGGGAGLGQAAQMIGSEARSTAPVWFGDQALTLDIRPDPRADSVALITLDAKGRELIREEIGPGSGEIDWFGRDDMDAKLPDGAYSFRIESLRQGEVIAESDVGVWTRITGAEATAGGTTLILEGDSTAPMEQVQAIRAPDANR